MEMILKVVGSIVGIFVILNGLWVITMPPTGDEPQGYAIVAIGFFMLLLLFSLSRAGPGRYS